MSVVGAIFAVIGVIFFGFAVMTFLRFLGYILKWVIVGGAVLLGGFILFAPIIALVALIAAIVAIISAIVRHHKNRYDNAYPDEATMENELDDFYGKNYDYGTYKDDSSTNRGTELSDY